MDFKAGVCNFCGTGCGHFLKVEGEAVTAVSPHRGHPVSRGRLCLRGWHMNELLNTNDWIEKPLVREGGALREASLDEALDLLLSRTRALADPARELAVLASPRASNEDCWALVRAAGEALGTGNIGVSAEAGHREAIEALEEAFGVPGATGSLTDLDRADYVLVVGGDLTRQNPIVGANVLAAKRRGARVAVVSSSRTQMAKLATRYLPCRPGALRLLLDAAAKALLAHRAAEPGFTPRAAEGFPAYEASLAGLDPLRAALGHGVPAEELAAEMAHLSAARHALILFPSGISGLDRATLRALAALAVLAGLPPRPEGATVGAIPYAGVCNLQGALDMARALALPGGRPALDLLAEPSSPVKALLVVDHDDGIVRQRDRIAGLDFVAYIGAFKNPFMELAHVVLPVAHFFESDATFTATDRRVQFSPAKTAPPAGILPGFRLFARLAERAGRPLGFDSAAGCFADLAARTPGYAGMSHAGLSRGFGRHTASTPRAPRLPINPEPAAAPPADPDYPFALMVGKAQHFWHQNNLMRKTCIPRREYDATLLLYPSGYIEIHPDDAARLGTRDKRMVSVTSARGSMRVAVKVSPDIRPGTAFVPYFIHEMIPDFLIGHGADFTHGEDAVVPVRIERI